MTAWFAISEAGALLIGPTILQLSSFLLLFTYGVLLAGSLRIEVMVCMARDVQ